MQWWPRLGSPLLATPKSFLIDLTTSSQSTSSPST
uniref:Uncharacterized protein n=1 Tax=Arundo donax TaxID=35708 RepID=A0A0A8YCE6_ARUDO